MLPVSPKIWPGSNSLFDIGEPLGGQSWPFEGATLRLLAYCRGRNEEQVAYA
jgi:hypothetical protein